MFLRDLLHGLSWPRSQPSATTPPPHAVRVHGTWPLDTVLIQLSPSDALTARDLMTGVQIFGASGSGKTSGSLAVLVSAMLRDGWGMLVLTTKPGEADQWERWAARANRTHDVVRIRPDGMHHFNVLEYLNRHPDPGASIATNIGDMLMTLAKHAKPKAQGTEASEFFAESATRMVTQAIHLLRAASEPLTLQAISKVIAGAPNHPLEVEEPKFAEGFVATLLKRAQDRGSPQVESLCEYWLREYPGMNERTRGDVVSTLTSVIFRFTEPPFRELIASSRGNSYIPEMVDAGRIMILDCPMITYQQAGRLYQIAMKHLTQQAILRRACTDTTRPVAIIADEAQNFATHADYAYQAICRDFRGCTVYATQTIDNYREAVGSEASVEALLASLVLKVFHANAGSTNKWAENLIAADWHQSTSESFNQRGERNDPNFGISTSQQVHPQVLAAEFTRLAIGGTRNKGIVEAIVFQPGRIFAQSGKPVIRVAFQQG